MDTPHITDDEIKRLAEWVYHDHGSALPEAEFAEAFLLMVEDMAMLPGVEEAEQRQWVVSGYRCYQQMKEDDDDPN